MRTPRLYARLFSLFNNTIIDSSVRRDSRHILALRTKVHHLHTYRHSTCSVDAVVVAMLPWSCLGDIIFPIYVVIRKKVTCLVSLLSKITNLAGHSLFRDYFLIPKHSRVYLPLLLTFLLRFPSYNSSFTKIKFLFHFNTSSMLNKMVDFAHGT